jgi:hypothetical protein
VRVQRKGQEQCGLVIDQKVEDGVLLSNVHWGSRPPSKPGEDGVMITEWIPAEELEPYPYAIVPADEIAARAAEAIKKQYQ